MQLWAVTMVKDEADVIAHTIANLDAQGVDGIIVADNLSTDGTWELLRDLPTTCQLIVGRDSEVGYYQSRKMTELAHRAFNAGANWVIPFDADELWYGTTMTLREAVTTADADCLRVPLHNYFPSKTDNAAETNPFARITHRDPIPAPLPKVIVKARPDVVIAQGNHNATGDDPYTYGDAAVEIAHFAWRSFAQYERKIRNGSVAYRNTDLPEHVGAHWRQHGEILDRDVSELRDVFDTFYVDPPFHLEHAPAPRQ